MADLLDLIARLERAEGPDRELDCQIAVAVDGFYELPPKWEGGPVGYGYTDAEGTPIHPGHGGDQLVRRYTSSIDAAVSLAERVLPGFGISIETHPVYGDWWYASVFGRIPMTIANAHKQTGPLAICLAVLRALDQKGSSNG